MDVDVGSDVESCCIESYISGARSSLATRVVVCKVLDTGKVDWNADTKRNCVCTIKHNTDKARSEAGIIFRNKQFLERRLCNRFEVDGVRGRSIVDSVLA